MANKALKEARKAYSKNKDTKYKWENGKKTEKKKPKREKEKSVASSYGQVEKKTQTVGSQGEKNRKNASVKKAASSVKKSVTPSRSGAVSPVSSHFGNVSNKSKDRTFTDKKWTVSNVASKVKETANVHSGANNKNDTKKPTTVSSHFGQVAGKTQELGKKHSKKVGYDDSDVKDYIGKKGTAKGTEEGKAYNRYKTADDALKKEGEKKVTTTKNASLLYGIDAAIQKAGYMSKQPAEAAKFYDKEEKKAQKEGMTYGDKKEFIRKWVSDKSNEEVLNAIDEYKNQKIKDSSYTYTKAPTSTGDFFIRENASKYATNRTKTETNQPVYQTDKDGNIKYDKNGKPKVKKDKNGNVVYQKIDSNQGNNILDYYGGGFDKNGRLTNQNASTEVGNQTAGWIHDAPVAAGVMQGLSYSDITKGLGNYSNAAAKDLENTKKSGAFNVGYMIGQGGQFLLGGTNKMTDALVKGIAKSGATRSALNVGLRKGGADIMFEAPLNTLDALKMSTDANGNFDKKAFFKYMALNTGLSGGMGGVIGGVGAKMTKSDVRKFAELSEKLNKNIELTPDELKQYDKIQKKLDSALQGNDRVKEDYINAEKADAVLSKADKDEYMSLLGKKQTGKLTQQENVRLDSYNSVIKQNYDEAQNNYAKVLADASAGEKVNIKDVKDATEFFERSGDTVKSAEAESVLAKEEKAQVEAKFKEENDAPHGLPKSDEEILREMNEQEQRQFEEDVKKHEKEFAEYKRTHKDYEQFQKIDDLEAEREKIIDEIDGTNATPEQEARLDEIYEEIEAIKKEIGAKSEDDYYWKRYEALGKVRHDLLEKEGLFDKAYGKESKVEEKRVSEPPKKTPKEEKPKRVFYHAGDLGKSEWHHQQAGSKRHTGHYGTGTYFTSDPEILKREGYGNRPLKEVDATDYNLYRPDGYDTGIRVHDNLRTINRSSSDLNAFIRKAGTTDEDISAMRQTVEGAGEYSAENLESLNEVAEKVLSKGDIDELKRVADEAVEQRKATAGGEYRDAAEQEFERFKKEMENEYGLDVPESERARYINDYIESRNKLEMRSPEQEYYYELSDRLTRELDGNTQYGKSSFLDDVASTRKAVSQLAEDLGKTEEEVNKAIEKAADTIKGYGEKAKEDSASTIIMKELGYDGVDVSGIKGLDNTEYGSVIYDLRQAEKSKPKTKTPTETKPKPEETTKEPQTATPEAKEAKKTEAQKLSENKYASDEVKTALKDIEDAGVYKEDAEKVAKKFNDLDKKIAGLQKRLNNAKNKDYPTEAEKTAHIAELEDELKTLRSQQAKAAGKLEQMGKMKAVDDSVDPQEQFHKLRGETKTTTELKNAENLKNEDNWIKDKWNSVRRLWEDSLIEVENTAKKVGGQLREEILTAANRVRNSQNVANFWITQGRSSFDNKVSGKSLDEIFPKELVENEAKYKDFQEYLIMKHVPARHAKGTDIYPEVSPELADKIVKKLENDYGEELTSWADDVYGYLKDLQQYRVDSGMLSKEAADKFAKDYPFYVPTNRANDDEAIDFFTGGLSNQIRTAKGGSNDVLDMYAQLYTATNKTIHAAEENQMLNLYFRAKGVTEEQIKQYGKDDLEHAVINATVNKKNGSAKVSFFIDGKPVEFPCSHQLALGLRELDGLEFERLMNAAKVSTLYGKPFKALITDWNIVFGVRNGMRDMQQAVVNSKDTRYFGSSFGAAGHAIAHDDSPYRKLYASMGGERAQLVSYDAVAKNLGIEKRGKVDAIHEKVQDWVDASVNVKGKEIHTNPVHLIEGVNGAIEMMPRMCEFIGTLRKQADNTLKQQGSSLKKLRKEIIAEVEADESIGQSMKSAEVENRLAQKVIDMVDKDTIDSAMRNANDITLNFGRSGVLGKALNMGFVPYLNPSIQGLSKLVRLFTEAGGEGGWKALASLGMKLGTFTIAPAVFNEVLLKDNEDYQNLNTRDKDNNFFIPLDKFGEAWEGKFFKFPKPRENAVLAEPVEYGLRYFLDKSEYAFFDWDKLKTEDVPLWEKIPLTDEGKQSLRTALDNIGVINPATSNMVSPLWQTFNNKTWYGGSIESAYETSVNDETGKPNVPVNERYDVSTTGLAIALGQTKGAKALNLSPKKIDNILDSYTGMVYDLYLSQTTEEAKTRGNYLFRTVASQFVKDSVFSNKLSTKAWEKMDGMTKKEQDAYKSKYMYDTFKYDDAMDVITADKNMTVQEKMDAKRALMIKKNELNRAAINGEENNSNPLKDISKYLGANKTLNNFLPKSGDEDYDNWTDYYKNYKKTKGFKNLTPAQKEKQAQKFLDVYTLGVKGQSKVSGDFHDSPSWSMTGVAAAQRYKQGKLSEKDAKTIMESCGVYESQTESYFKYADHGGNVSRYAVTKKNNNKAEALAEELGVPKKGSVWENKYSKEKGIKGGVLSMSLATGKADFKDRAYYISNSGDSNMLIKMNAARGYSEKYGHTTKQLIKLGKKADADGNTYLSNEEIESACMTIKKGKATSEERAMAWVLLGGNPNKNPFGAIGNYAHDGDTGITADEDGKSGGGHGRRRRGRRGRGGGGGGGSKGTMPKTESGAIKGKVTDVFASSNGSKDSNLNDAYRKKLRKSRENIYKGK